ncbi:MAG: UPF0182 family protein [Abditibacteriota bacterium]|nr:UPF0182 family protein [Abditibacteriota bacterium]
MNKKVKKIIGWAIAVLIVLIILNCIPLIINFYVDWLWFKSLNYENIFLTIFKSKICLGFLMGLIFFVFAYANILIAKKMIPIDFDYIDDNIIQIGNYRKLAQKILNISIFIIILLISISVGKGAAGNWELYQFYTHPTNFNITDPIFHKDISFYFFSLPFLKYLYVWGFGSLIGVMFITGIVYCLLLAPLFVYHEGYSKENLKTIGKVKCHALILLSLCFFLKILGYKFQIYGLLFNDSGLFSGMSYTDHHILIPTLYIKAVLGLVWIVVLLINIKLFKKVKHYIIMGSILAFTILVNIIITPIPGLYEKYIVTPNQYEKEKPYIENAIKFTNHAYGLDKIDVEDFPANNILTMQDLENNKPTIENIRLWNSEQLKHSYSQVQTIQQYYSFKDIDVDRYWIKDGQGELKYRQVWLSARELKYDKEKSWVNRKLQYTHGYGYVMSPINESTAEGMPKFFVYDIPPKTNTNIPIKENGIYIGENDCREVIVNTKTPEFDYPKGSEIVNTTYTGSDGMVIKNFFHRLLFAYYFKDINIVFNKDITEQSKILYRRQINERINHLFPFVEFDPDPYLVTGEGNLYWMVDGFTKSEYYPYSDIEYGYRDRYNYIRNSIKLVVNAYTGEVNIYAINIPYEDPIVESYKKIFPNVFKDISQMPKELVNHIRYSEEMFRVQTEKWTTYHQTNPQVFYNKSDLWRVSKYEPLCENKDKGDYSIDDDYYTYDTWSSHSGDQSPYYYNIMRLPGNQDEEFILMNTFTRAGKENMCAWICVGCDGDNYGKITLYNFPKDKNVYGPSQIIAKAKQDDIISPQITLWSQEGSGVTTGKLLTIPIEKSLLYVLPVYLESDNTKIPELKRVIVALGDKIIMDKDLNSALYKLISGGSFVKAEAVAKPKEENKQKVTKTPQEAPKEVSNKPTKEEISGTYKKAKEAAQKGDWATYGKEIDKLGELIEKL